MRILIFGGTPLARRLDFYLTQYAQVKDIDVTVVRRVLDSTSTLHKIQHHVWNTYVSETQGRVDLIINAHEERRLAVCETDPTAAWRNNTRHAAWIAYAARTADLPLIQWSSDHVFRGSSGPYEDTRDMGSETPVNVYGVTKWYAEQIVQRLHPKTDDQSVGDPRVLPGTTIIRTSDLYGVDVVDSVPAELAHQKDGERIVSGIVANPARVSPSFIGEVAFLTARNILLSPASLNAPVVHLAPVGAQTDWANYLRDLGHDVKFLDEEPKWSARAQLHRQGQVRGLIPTSGWFLPSDASKSFAEFLAEFPPDERVNFTRYWDAQ